MMGGPQNWEPLRKFENHIFCEQIWFDFVPAYDADVGKWYFEAVIFFDLKIMFPHELISLGGSGARHNRSLFGKAASYR